jgi:pyruvate formate-lyase activating enzyme-like uncharacterized protein
MHHNYCPWGHVMSAVHRLANNAFYTHHLPDGCTHCAQGAKMVLLVTGLCHTQCFYCPLSSAKKNRDIIYANEQLVSSDDDILEEAANMAALGTGITGGEPLSVLDRTLQIISLLKDTFGSHHHIHLYTSDLDESKADALVAVGLDELRYHPHIKLWTSLKSTPLEYIVANLPIPVGLEIPLLPHLYRDMEHLIHWAATTDIAFVNLNELEFSSTNGDALRRHGYHLKNDISNAAAGSESLAYQLADYDIDLPIHYCSSSFKDAVQLRKRLLRRASITAPLYAVITEDGTLLKGIIYCPSEAVSEILKTFSIASHLLQWDTAKQWAETSPDIVRAIAPHLPYVCYIVEEYPTADRLEVEREPL